MKAEHPSIGFREGVGGREAFVLRHRVAVWEVVDLVNEVKTVPKAAEHFRWQPALIRAAMNFAGEFPDDIKQQRLAEVGK